MPIHFDAFALCRLHICLCHEEVQTRSARAAFSSVHATNISLANECFVIISLSCLWLPPVSAASAMSTRPDTDEDAESFALQNECFLHLIATQGRPFSMLLACTASQLCLAACSLCRRLYPEELFQHRCMKIKPPSAG